MKTYVRFFALVLLAIAAMNPQSIHAQQTTERYIPIGASPGLSGAYNWIGEITDVDRQAGTVTVRNEQGNRTIRITDTTDVWVDRTAMQRTNTTGSMTDLIVGRRVEIKYTDYTRREVADWIKVAGS